jgi:hypothetical protein
VPTCHPRPVSPASDHLCPGLEWRSCSQWVGTWGSQDIWGSGTQGPHDSGVRGPRYLRGWGPWMEGVKGHRSRVQGPKKQGWLLGWFTCPSRCAGQVWGAGQPQPAHGVGARSPLRGDRAAGGDSRADLCGTQDGQELEEASYHVGLGDSEDHAAVPSLCSGADRSVRTPCCLGAGRPGPAVT